MPCRERREIFPWVSRHRADTRKPVLARRLAPSLPREPGLPRQRAQSMMRQLGATPLPFLAILRLLALVPVSGIPLPLGMMSPLAMLPPPEVMRRLVMAPILGMPLQLGTMTPPKMAPLPTTALPSEAAPPLVMTLILGVPLRFGMFLLKLALLRGRALLSGAVSLPQMMFQPVAAQHHQGWTSPAFRMTPAEQ